MKPDLKPPGTKRLKLQHDIMISTSAFKFILRRYIKAKGTCARYMGCCEIDPRNEVRPGRYRFFSLVIP
jgi:hypothetical protein